MEMKLKQIMANVLKVQLDEINEGTTIENVESWDSLSHMQLILTIEEQFGVKLAEEDFLIMTSFNEIKRILENKGISFSIN